MKVLGRIKGNEVVLEKSDGASALRLVNEIPDPAGDLRTVQLEEDIGSYKRGTILVSDGTTWKEVLPPTDTVGDVSHIICPRVGYDVQIRWTDPNDTTECVWKRTLVIRKYGYYPEGIHDGVVVVDSRVRNQFASTPWHDVLPAGTEEGWYYQIYTCSEDNIWHGSISARFQPIELSYDTINQIVRDGLASKVFDIGDELTVCGTQTSPFYKEMKFAVAAFDQATPTDLTHTHSMTMVMIGTLGNCPCVWDKPWPDYLLTNDYRVTDRSKEYYIWDGAHFVKVTNLPIGKILEPNTYYEKNLNEERKTNGGNRWSSSALRKWLNSTTSTEADGWWFKDYPEKVLPPLTQMPQEFVKIIQSTRNKTALPEPDGRTGEISTDMLFLLSATEVFGRKTNIYTYTETKDTTPQEIYIVTSDTARVIGKTYFVFDATLQEFRLAKATDFNEDGSFKEGAVYYELTQKAYFLKNDDGTYRQATDDDFTEDHKFKEGVTYYDQTISVIEENPYTPYFEDEELNPRVQYDKDGNPREWWLRTANRETNSYVSYVDTEGKEVPDGELAQKEKYISFAFTIS